MNTAISRAIARVNEVVSTLNNSNDHNIKMVGVRCAFGALDALAYVEGATDVWDMGATLASVSNALLEGFVELDTLEVGSCEITSAAYDLLHTAKLIGRLAVSEILDGGLFDTDTANRIVASVATAKFDMPVYVSCVYIDYDWTLKNINEFELSMSSTYFNYRETIGFVHTDEGWRIKTIGGWCDGINTAALYKAINDAIIDL